MDPVTDYFNNYFNNFISGFFVDFIIFIGVLILLFLLGRAIMLWYWKIDEIVDLLKSIKENTSNPVDGRNANNMGTYPQNTPPVDNK